MRKLNNDNGSMLIILIIAMTLIAVLGAGLVSIISSKQESYTLLLNAQRANMVAKAGVEWAIRFASDGPSPTLSPTIIHYIIPEDTSAGSFTTQYNYGSDILTVSGFYNGVSARTELSNFRRYLSPISLASINGSLATISGTQILVPVIGNISPNTTVSQLDITIPPVSVNTWLKTIKHDATTVFVFSTSTYRLCAMYPPPCKDANGINLPLSSPIQLSISTSTHDVVLAPPESTYYLDFSPSPPVGQYKIKLNSAPAASEISFTP